ncbi:MAG: sigma-70 family RNA polymerase sigma factor [Gemmataceae bacterium]
MDDSEEALVERLRAGEEAVLAELFSLHRDRLWRMLNFRMDRRLAGRVDAEDILQEAYLSASGRIEHYRKEESMSFFVWLRLIVNQTLIDVHRRHIGAEMRDANREVSLHHKGNAQSTSMSLAAKLLGNITSPSQAAVREETSAQLERAIASMDTIDQEVLALRHFEDLTNSEVAEVLGIAQTAASNRYVRALARLKDILAKIPGFLDS